MQMLASLQQQGAGTNAMLMRGWLWWLMHVDINITGMGYARCIS
jgi:hypothetical protein